LPSAFSLALGKDHTDFFLKKILPSVSRLALGKEKQFFLKKIFA
jgi:hypothetical protein